MNLGRSLIPLIEPISLLWLALILLAVLLWRKRARGFAIVAGTLAIFIYVIGASTLPVALLRSLERPYFEVKLDALPACDAVVMLGGALDPSPNEVAGLHLTIAADRLITALEVVRLGKAPVLVCGGSGIEVDGTMRIEGDMLKNALIERRVPIPEIVSLGLCSDTHDEALRTHALAKARGWKRVLLVTSAAHLPRATATFRAAGIDVVPVPCNFHTRQNRGFRALRRAIPGTLGFEKTSVWLHEKIGWWEYRRRGWIPAP